MNDKLTQNMFPYLPAGIVHCQAVGEGFIFDFISEGTAELFGYAQEEFESLLQEGLTHIVHEQDLTHVISELKKAFAQQASANFCFRIRCKTQGWKWCHFSGKADTAGCSGMLAEMPPQFQLYRHIAKKTADGIYVIKKDTYEMLYENESKLLFAHGNPTGRERVGRKCYEALRGKSEPCLFCTLRDAEKEDKNHLEPTVYEDGGKFYSTYVSKYDWSGEQVYVKYVRDVTEDISVQKEKERLEQYFQTVLKYLPGGTAVVCHKKNGEMFPEFLSDGFAEMVNMPMEQVWELYRKDALSGVHPDDRDRLREQLNKCISEKKDHYEIVYRLRKGEEGYLWVKATFSLILSEGGDTRVYVNYNDITAERENARILRKQYKEQLLKHYLTQGPNVMVLGHCNITANQITEIDDHTDSDLLETFGSVREDFFRGIATLVVDSEQQEDFLHSFLNMPSLVAFQQGEKEILRRYFIRLPKEKHGRYAQFKVNLLETPNSGDITGILTVTDVTNQVIRDQILRQISVNSCDLIIDLDLIHDTYVMMNGADDKDMLSKKSHSQHLAWVINHKVPSREREYMARMLDTKYMLERLQKENSYTFSYSIMEKDGEIRTKKLVVTAIDLRLGRVCITRTDITDVMEAERKSKEALKEALVLAEKANKAKSEFLSSMSHDIRTPMNAIIGMTTLGLANLENQAKLEDYLKKISFSSKHLLSLINDILDMSKIEQGGISLNCAPLSMKKLIEQITSMMEPQAKEAGIAFYCQTENLQHETCKGDSLRINQILINLLGNALKFTPEGGKVLFRIEEIPPLKKQNRSRYRFTIQDTGVGMTQEFLEHLFEPFTRSSNVFRVEGTGLGLSITKGLIDLMGGMIQVESRIGEGTTFVVELEFELSYPEQEKENQTLMCEQNNAETLTGCHFLVAEDNALNAEILCELLQMQGASTVVKGDGLQVVQEFEHSEEGKYDAILMDIQMPVMNGFEATKAIRKLSKKDAISIPIVAMTANAFAEDVQAALDAGMNEHVAKPVDMQILCNTLRKVL